MNTVKSGWDRFVSLVVPKGSDKQEIANARLAYYSGAAAMFERIETISADTPDEDVAVLKLESVREELLRFITECSK
jgi:hypothetical protein